jgi:hypothetical protein
LLVVKVNKNPDPWLGFLFLAPAFYECCHTFLILISLSSYAMELSE